MIVTISSNAGEVAAQIKAGADALPRAASNATKNVLQEVVKATTQAMEEGIYHQPLPESYSRYGRTDRTGALLAGEAGLMEGEHEGVVVTVNTGVGGVDPTRYAETRHENVSYPAPWRKEGLEEVQPKLPKVAEEAIIEAMPHGLVVR